MGVNEVSNEVFNDVRKCDECLFHKFQKSLDLNIEEDYQLNERLDNFKKEISHD
jgi:hypothetical protein